jgi:hypothetical protein
LKSKVITVIKTDHPFGVDIYIDEISFFLNYSIDKKAKLLEHALNKMENDLLSVSKHSSKSNYASFVWCLTYDDHRFDTTKGTVLDYYLIEILSFLVITYEVAEIHFYKYFDQSVLMKVMQRCNVRVRKKYKFKAKCKSWVRYKFGTLRQLKGMLPRVFSFNSIHEIEGLKTKQFDVILAAHPNSTPRWKSYDKQLKENNKNVLFLHPSISQYSYGENYWKPLKLMTLNSILKTVYDTYMFKKSLKGINQNSDIKENLFFRKIKKQSFLQSIIVFIRFDILRKLYDQNIRAVHVMTTFGDPLKRLVLAAASNSDIERNIFSCRPALSRLRSEDRLIQTDFMKGITDLTGVNFYGFDSFTRDHIRKSGYPINFIPWKIVESGNTEMTKFQNCVLILFSYSEYNDFIIDTLERLKMNLPSNTKLLLREHQSVRLDSLQMNRLESLGFNVAIITDYLWSELYFKNTLAIVGDSTAGLDALDRGCSLCWITYASEYTTVSYPIMKKVGQLIYSENDLSNFFKKYFDKSKATEIDSVHQKQYKKYIALTED